MPIMHHRDRWKDFIDLLPAFSPGIGPMAKQSVLIMHVLLVIFTVRLGSVTLAKSCAKIPAHDLVNLSSDYLSQH